MLNQLLKFTLVSSVLLWLRPRWRGLLALTVLVVLVHVLHGEYLGYVELSGDRDYLVWSYVIKWLVLLAGVTAYFFYAVSGVRPKVSRGRTVEATGNRAQQPALAADDGFDFLRNKQQLQNRADKIIHSEKGDA